jgi:hypothetical protein
MIILYTLLFLLVPTVLGLLLWQCFRAEKLLNAQKEMRLIQMRQLARQLRAQRQEVEQLHADVNHFQLPLPNGQIWWVLNALFKAFKVRQLRKLGSFNVSQSAPRTTALLNP